MTSRTSKGAQGLKFGNEIHRECSKSSCSLAASFHISALDAFAAFVINVAVSEKVIRCQDFPTPQKFPILAVESECRNKSLCSGPIFLRPASCLTDSGIFLRAISLSLAVPGMACRLNFRPIRRIWTESARQKTGCLCHQSYLLFESCQLQAIGAMHLLARG